MTVKRTFPVRKYYWRVRGADSDGQESDFSGTYSFNASQAQKMKLINPPDGSEYDYYNAQSPGVNLTWERPPLSGRFRLVVAENVDFTSPLVSENLTGFSKSLSKLKPGKYFWQVRLLARNGTLITESDVQSFTVTNDLVPPVLVFPGDKSRVDMTRRNSLPFEWESVRGASSYRLRFYQTQGGLILDTRVRGTKHTLNDLTKLDVGSFYWTLQAAGAGGRTSPEVRNSFAITLEENYKQPEILTPETQYISPDEEEARLEERRKVLSGWFKIL